MSSTLLKGFENNPELPISAGQFMQRHDAAWIAPIDRRRMISCSYIGDPLHLSSSHQERIKSTGADHENEVL